MQTPKILAFEYVVKELLCWYAEKKGNANIKNDLSILKSLKLLFFVAASDAKPNKHNILLDEVFENFVAMPYGHVESDVYNTIRIKSGVLEYYKLTNQNTTCIANKNIGELDLIVEEEIKQAIVNSISQLKLVNPNLILMSAFELVDLSHAWYSWQYNYKIANEINIKSSHINSDIIKSEDKIFTLQMI
jgi:uncharacterized phage-associated protein